MHLIGPAIRAHRERRGIGVRDLAATVGLSPSYLSRIETGKRLGRGIEWATVAAIAEALKVPVEAISTRTEDAA